MITDMKEKILYGYLCLLTILMIFSWLASCQKSPINGDLDGQWQILNVEPEVKDAVLPGRLYYCFSLHVCQLTHSNGGAITSGNLYYDKVSGLIHLDFPYDKSEISVLRLKQYGINSNPVTFNIEYLDKKKLIMRDGDTVITLRKF